MFQHRGTCLTERGRERGRERERERERAKERVALQELASHVCFVVQSFQKIQDIFQEEGSCLISGVRSSARI